VDLTRGKLLGGSSAINVLALIYPHRSTIDAWEKELGNKGWNFDDLAPYYRKAISTQEPEDAAAKALDTHYLDKKVHDTVGPIQSSFPKFYSPLGEAWGPTFKNLNLTTTADPSSGEGYGAYTSLATIDTKTAERSHSGSAYYEPAASRPNLHLVTDAQVEKIILTKGSGEPTATGVQYLEDGKSQVVSAAREVLLCAGAFQSPQILELSGVGNPEILSKYGIETLVDLPYVGENMQDHPLSGLCYEVNDGIPTVDMIRDPAVIQACMQMYMTDRNGPLTSGFYSAAVLPVEEFAASDAGRAELKALLDAKLDYSSAHTKKLPSISKQYAVHRASLENPHEASVFLGMGAIQMHFEQVLQKDIFAISDPGNFMIILAALTSPLSRGSVHIASADPLAKPAIDPQYLAHPLDVEVYARHMRYIPTIAATAPLKDLLKVGGKRLPAKQDLSTVEAAKDHVSRHVISNNHAASTCPMMPKELGGVVDTKLRVYGVKGLRVVDASVMPMIPKGNIQSTVYAVAEKAADLIKEDW